MLRHPGSLIGINSAAKVQWADSLVSCADSSIPLASTAEICEVEDNKVRPRRSLLPIWEGSLKQKKSMRFGLGSDVWRDRLARLDPQSGLLSIWSIEEGQKGLASSVMGARFQSVARGPPKKQFELSCIRGLQSDPHKLDIMILFSAKSEQDKVKYALQFRAPTVEDHNKWMFVLGHFGIRHDTLGLDVEVRGILPRPCSSMMRHRGLKAHDSHGDCVKDTESVNSIVASDSGSSNIEGIDNDVLADLSAVLNGISPCNRKWCKKVGLEPKKKSTSRL